MFTKIAPRLISRNTPRVLDVAMMDGRYVFCYTAENSIRIIGKVQTAHNAAEIVALARQHSGSIRADAATWELLECDSEIASRLIEP